jgi:hypothetical protein
MKPKKTTSRYEKPYHLLNEDEKTKLNQRREKTELAEHFLVKVGHASYGCACGSFYTSARSPREAESSQHRHNACVKEHLTERANNVPDWD